MKVFFGWALAAICLAGLAAGCGGVRSADVPATYPEARIRHWEGVDNVRDLGGLNTKDGKVVKSGMIFRSQAFNDDAVSDWATAERIESKIRSGILDIEFGPANAQELEERIDKANLHESCVAVAKKLQTDKEWWRRGAWRGSAESRARIVRETGLRTEIDLRTPSECWGMKSSPLGPEVAWTNIPGVAISGLPTPQGKEVFAKCFRIFLDPQNYPIDFHCIAGADRTGALAFALEGILNVNEKEMEEDYTLTSRSNSGRRTAKAFWKMAKAFDRYPGAGLHEKVCAYAQACGFTDDELAAFRRIMLQSK